MGGTNGAPASTRRFLQPSCCCTLESLPPSHYPRRGASRAGRAGRSSGARAQRGTCAPWTSRAAPDAGQSQARSHFSKAGRALMNLELEAGCEPIKHHPCISSGANLERSRASFDITRLSSALCALRISSLRQRKLRRFGNESTRCTILRALVRFFGVRFGSQRIDAKYGSEATGSIRSLNAHSK